MKKGVLTRLVIHNILYSLKKNHEFFEKTAYENISKFNLNTVDKKFVVNIVLTSLRENFVIKDSIKKFSKTKKISLPVYLLLLSAVTQIICFNIKSYAVINCSVEIA